MVLCRPVGVSLLLLSFCLPSYRRYRILLHLKVNAMHRGVQYRYGHRSSYQRNSAKPWAIVCLSRTTSNFEQSRYECHTAWAPYFDDGDFNTVLVYLRIVTFIISSIQGVKCQEHVVWKDQQMSLGANAIDRIRAESEACGSERSTLRSGHSLSPATSPPRLASSPCPISCISGYWGYNPSSFGQIVASTV